MTAEPAHWLAAEDLTTPAHDRRCGSAPPAAPQARRDGRSGRADAVVFLAGVWLVIAAVPVAYRATLRFDVLWNDTVAGLAVAAVTLVRLAGRASALRGVTCALGAWLGLAPFALGYGAGPTDVRALANDIAVGLVVVVGTLAGAATAQPIQPTQPIQPIQPIQPTQPAPAGPPAADSAEPGLIVGRFPG